MSAYTVSRLALDAGVSVHIVRDYLLRGLLRPVACTPGGYGLWSVKRFFGDIERREIGGTRSIPWCGLCQL